MEINDPASFRFRKKGGDRHEKVDGSAAFFTRKKSRVSPKTGFFTSSYLACAAHAVSAAKKLFVFHPADAAQNQSS